MQQLAVNYLPLIVDRKPNYVLVLMVDNSTKDDAYMYLCKLWFTFRCTNKVST